MMPAFNTTTASYAGRPLRPIVSHDSGGAASVIAEPATITPTVVISASSMGGHDATLSVPMGGQADAPPTGQEVALAAQLSQNGSANGNGAPGSAPEGAPPKKKGFMANISTRQWCTIGAIGLGILLLARK